MIDREDPDVVAVLVGRWEVHDHLLNGHWTHIGEPEFDALVARRLDQGVAALTSHGAHVVLLTSPYFDGLERPDGGRWPEDDPARVDGLNRIVRKVAARHPGVVTVFDLRTMLSLNGRYSRVIDGVTVRSADGNHITGGGAQLVARVLLPKLVAAGQEHKAERLAHRSS